MIFDTILKVLGWTFISVVSAVVIAVFWDWLEKGEKRKEMRKETDKLIFRDKVMDALLPETKIYLSNMNEIENHIHNIQEWINKQREKQELKDRKKKNLNPYHTTSLSR